MKFKTFLPIFIAMAISACGTSSETPKNSSNSGNKEISGVELYNKNCTACHGKDGNMGIAGAKKLPESVLTQSEREDIINNGKGTMPAFTGKLSPEEIKAVAEHTFSLSK